MHVYDTYREDAVSDRGVAAGGGTPVTTKQHETEKALRLSEERFWSAMLHSPIGMAIVATDGRWLEVNPAFCAIVGYSRDELLAIDVSTITHGDDVAADLDHASRLLSRALDAYQLEKRYRQRNGTIVWVQVNVSLVRDAEDTPLHFVGQIQDITARKQADAELRESRAKLVLAMAMARLGHWEYDVAADQFIFNEDVYRLLGTSAEREGGWRLSSKHFAERFLPAGEAPMVAVEIERAVNTTDPNYSRHLEHGFRRADGTEGTMSVRVAIMKDAAGRTIRTYGVIQDITEQKRAERQRLDLQEQLRHAQKMETLGTLAAGIVHDFNNLLTGINGFVELGTLSLPPGHEAVELLTHARSGVMQARELVRRILQFSRRSAGTQRSMVRLDEVVRDTAPLIAAVLPANISLAMEAEGLLPSVLADTGQIQQVLMNLCVNGSHAIGTAAGTVCLAVGRCAFAREGGVSPPAGCLPGEYVRLAVTDTGCGMDEATRARVFEPFFTTKKAGEGTGLGLAVVKDIVADHGGVIRVQSTLGCGTTFEILLPATPAVARTAGAPVAARATRAGQRILLMDDEAPARELAAG